MTAAPVVGGAPADENARVAGPPLKKMRVADLINVSQAPIIPDENKTLFTSSGEWAAAEAITKAIPKDQGVPMTILTGFLGAGKSTVLNYILNADHGLKIAVLINEYGEVDIDNQLVDSVGKGEEGEPILLNNGCVCCTISSGFADAVRRTLEQADARGRIPDYFIVETTGLADPKPIVDSVSVTELREEVYIDQILTVVDASVWDETHYGSETAKNQILAADTVLLSKTDLADEATVEKVVQSVLTIRPNARLLRSQRGYVPIAALFDLGVTMSTSSRKRKTPPSDDNTHTEKKDLNEHVHEDESAHDHQHGHKDESAHNHQHGESCGKNCSHKHSVENKQRNHLAEEGFTSISFVSEFPLSMRRFRQDFMDNLPVGVFRAKGLLWFAGDPNRFIFHWSGQRFQAEEQKWPEGSERRNQLVVIGRQLNRDAITEFWERCIVKPGEESEDDEDDFDEDDYLDEEEMMRARMMSEEDDEYEEGEEEEDAEGEEGDVGSDGEDVNEGNDGQENFVANVEGGHTSTDGTVADNSVTTGAPIDTATNDGGVKNVALHVNKTN